MNSRFDSPGVWDWIGVVVMVAVGVAGWATDYAMVALPAAALAASAVVRLVLRSRRGMRTRDVNGRGRLDG